MLFISSIISPWEEGGWEIDSRLVIPIISPWDENILEPNKLTLDLDMEIDDFDMDPVSAVVDDLLTKENHQMQNFREICNYMYISGSSQVLFGNPESHGAETKYLPINTELLWAHYNLSVLILFLNLLQRADYGEESDQDVFVLSDAQMACLKNLCGKFVLLSAAEKMNDNQCKKELSACMPDLHSGLVKCLNTLTCMQLSKLVDYASMEDSTKPSSLDILGMTQLLQIIIDKNEVPRKKSMALKSNIYKLRCSFMSSCELPAIVTSELKTFLEDSGVSETCLNNAFSLPSKQQEPMDVGNEHIMIKSISLCLSGFFEMNLGYKALNSDCKTEHFQKLSMITNRLKEKNVHLLNSSDSMPVPVHLLELNVCIARSLKHLMVPSSDQYWEFTLCTLVEWVQFLSENKGYLCNDVHMQALAISVFELSFEAAQIFSASSEEGQISSEITSVGLVTEKAKTEWSEFFAEGVFSPLLPMFVSLATTRERWDPALWTLIQAPLSSVVSLCPGWLVLTHQLPPHLTASDTSSLSDSIKTLLNHLCPLLMSRESFVELAAYFILRKAIEEIAIQDSKANEMEDEEETKSPPEALIIQLEAAAHFLEFLKVGQVGEHIVLNEGTEDMSQAMGFLLLWRLLLFLFKSSPDELRAKYAQYFKAQGSVSCLLDYLFRLMPQYPDPAMVESSTELKLNENFQGEPNKQLEWLSVQVYRDCLEILPALVRTWWMEQDRRSSNFVDRFTTQYLSTGLIWQQIASSQSNDDNKIEGITIKSRPAAREVLATYEMAEVTINMTITLPENFPLGKLDVACDRRVGVSQAQWDRWLLQLNIFLQHQNGSIVEGLRLWKGNIDKKFEGLDDCMICFSVIHGTTLQLPRLSCRTCRKKFHSTCLYKWFSTSQKSSCPLCRNLF
ncbi:hypothetical protein EGW08_021358 [Elysia chlorotica]|uniref:E3 ubiquitin-protein ligase listerin n=1 Tax=Elysia chlorotica TaxID=188477 RepID=A0A433SNQ0_ELYCH|nr:hypothetical protein EGW08_021358 [Elysia chlorotica]